MTWRKKDFDQILGTLKSRVSPQLTDFEPGSVVRTLFESLAYEMAVLYEEMEQVYDASFIDTATDADLDKVVAILGIQRGEPEFATGTVVFERDLGIDAAIEIPIDTLVTTEDAEITGGAIKQAYRTLESGTLQPDQTSIEIKVKAEMPAEAGETLGNTIVVMPQPIQGVKAVNNPDPIEFTGKRAETDIELRDRAKQTLLASSGSNTTAIEKALLSLPRVRAVKVSDVRDEAKNILPGRLSIVVDRHDFNEPELQATIERVRAAGVYHTLKQPIAQPIRGVFQIALRDEAKLNPDQKAEILMTVKSAITDYVTSLTMSEPLVVAQLTRHILNVPGVSNLTHFTLTQVPSSASTDSIDQAESPAQTSQASLPPLLPSPLPSEDYRVSLAPIRLAASKGVDVKISILLEWLVLGDLVPIDQVGPIEETFSSKLKESLQAEGPALRSYLVQETSGATKSAGVLSHDDLKELSQVVLQEIDGLKDLSNLATHLGSVSLQTQEWVKAADESWQPYADRQDDAIALRLDFIDNITGLNIGIAYATTLAISGGIQLILSPTLNEAEQTNLITNARQQIENHLDQLSPEADIEIPKLIDPIQEMNGVDGVIYEPKDFLANDKHDRLDEQQQIIRVEKYEKPQLADGFKITTKSEVITVTLTGLQLNLKVSWPIGWIEQSQIDAQLDRIASQTRLVDAVSKTWVAAKKAVEAAASEDSPPVTDPSITDPSITDLRDKANSILAQAKSLSENPPVDDELAISITSALTAIENELKAMDAQTPDLTQVTANLDNIQLPKLALPYRPNVFNDPAVIDENQTTTAQITEDVQQHRSTIKAALETYTKAVVESLFLSTSAVSLQWGLPAFQPGQDIDIPQLKGALVEQLSMAVNKLDNSQIEAKLPPDMSLAIDHTLMATAINLALLNATFSIGDNDSDIGLSTADSDVKKSPPPVTYIRSTQTAQLAPINLSPPGLTLSFQPQVTLS